MKRVANGEGVGWYDGVWFGRKGRGRGGGVIEGRKMGGETRGGWKE